MVAPSGSVKDAISFLAPSFSEHSMLSGRAPTEEALENAIIMAGIIPLKKLMGLTPPKTPTVDE